MNNKSSVNSEFTQKEIQLLYKVKHKKMEDTIMTNNDTIRMLMRKKQQLENTVEDLKKKIVVKNEETNLRLNDVRNRQKILNSELSKYKSMPAFEEILSLNEDLTDFQTEIKTAIETNSNMLQTNKREDEIEQMKRRNTELYRKLKNSDVKALVAEKSVELKGIEKEMSAKKDIYQQEIMKMGGRLAQIKERMAKATMKFTETVESSISELRKTLESSQKEMVTIDHNITEANDCLMYDKVKNILLQQENALIKEMIDSKAGSSTNTSTSSHTLLNNLSANQSTIKAKNTNINKANTVIVDNPLFLNKQSTTKEKNVDTNDYSDNNEFFRNEETSSVSRRGKTYKLILLNVHEDGNKSDNQKVRMVLKELTTLPLDDIAVERVGKPLGIPRPIIVSFDYYIYVEDVLKNKHLLKDTKFSSIRICSYKRKSNPNDPKENNNVSGHNNLREEDKNNLSKVKNGKCFIDVYLPF